MLRFSPFAQEDFDFPKGFSGEGNWEDVEHSLRLFELRRNRRTPGFTGRTKSILPKEVQKSKSKAWATANKSKRAESHRKWASKPENKAKRLEQQRARRAAKRNERIQRG